MSFRRIFCAVFLALGIMSPVAGQFLANPNDRIYRDLELWEGKGLIRQLPVLRPYPAQVVKELLEEAARKGGAGDAQKAREYLAEIAQPYYWHAEAGAAGRVEARDKDGDRDNLKYADAYLELQAGGWITENAHLEGRIRGLMMDNSDGFVLPGGARTDVDIFDTWADMRLAGRTIYLRQSQNVSFTLGDSNLYFQAGIMRNSFGPFWGDGVVLSADAPHTGHYSVVWRNSLISYSTALLELSATDSLRPQTEMDAVERKRYPDKHLALQSLSVYPADWLEVGYFGAIVWGGRMDFNYLLPFKELFYTQSMGGFEDNSLAGLMADVRIMDTVKLPFVMYVDDANLNDLLSFKFNTKFKAAIQAGLQWTPEDLGFLRLVAADYVIVTPYMYTHRANGLEAVPQPGDPMPGGGVYTAADRTDLLSQPNYRNYTHSGTNLGVGLDPNSDRVSLKILVEPVRDLRITFIGRMMRHANASMSMGTEADLDDPGPGGGRNDGSVYDDGYDKDGNPTFHYRSDFMKQDVIERTLQGGFQAEYSFRLGPGEAFLSGGYLFEYIKNKDLRKGETEANHYGNIGIGYRF
ncbi:MAG: hypothetical protein FWG35_04815 [Spirochaetaceae bacterium]|nr:hypothetical protein [Spirochaetaceae bacterium]